MQTKWGRAELDQYGYYWIATKMEGYYHKFLHRLIWEDVNGPILDGHVIHHIDENPLNNDISNLKMMSISEHRTLHMTGDKNPMHGKTHTEEVRKTLSEISKGKKASKESRLKIGKSHLKKLSQEEIIMIRLMFENNYYIGMIKDIVNLYKVGGSVISRIRSQETYGGV
jgi:hypothetical protein